MKYCQKCGNELVDEAVVCPGCGCAVEQPKKGNGGNDGLAIASKIFLILGCIAILLSGFLDVVDGAVARYHDRASPFGAFLDSTMDRFADAIIYIGIIFGGYCDWFVGVLAIHSAITVSYVRARAESQGAECNIGIAERAVRMIILMVGAIIGYFAGDIYFTYVIYLLVILSYFTVGQRIVHVWRQLK